MKQYKLNFEKFVKDIEEREKERLQEIEKLQEQEELNYARKLAELYRELPQNSTRYTRDEKR
tara:strand:+ start:1097 stop:1282 length:186 start_codon:yes stop_codon:yes gene_type:complete